MLYWNNGNIFAAKGLIVFFNLKSFLCTLGKFLTK